ncbi:hypothetical protein LguiB_008057 [Lonicera macranthoides]
MENSHSHSQDPNPNLKQQPLPADDHDHDLDLYTIPSYSSWFSWNDIHEIEKLYLKEFFDGSSITRSPKIYREYRDFIISKYREDPSRRLTFTEVRKSLVGDLTYLQKVFLFLERWGLINFGAPLIEEEDWIGKEEDRWKVKVEDGAPMGVRVVAVPGSLKPVSVPNIISSVGSCNGDVVDTGFQLPPLSSYSDVYSELMQNKKGLVCGNCKEGCDCGHYYEYTKERSFIICVKCFKNEDYGENKSADDFKLIECIPDKENQGAVWTEAETLLLLESVLKHGDDWELVSQNVQTKSKLDCISKLIELPFGELMLGSVHNKSQLRDTKNNITNAKHTLLASTESLETTKIEDRCLEFKNDGNQNGDAEDQDPPLKRARNAPISDATSSLMRQIFAILVESFVLLCSLVLLHDFKVSLISTMVGPRITASASEAAVTAICYENLCPREMFDGVDIVGDEKESSPQNEEGESAPPVKDSELEEMHSQSESQEIPLTLRMRAASATALGAAAARAKLLADREDREIEHLVATIIEMQLKKLKYKMKHIEDLEVIMEKEREQMEKVEESILEERMNVLQRIFNAGISRWRDHTSVKIVL